MTLNRPVFLTRAEWLRWKSRIESAIRNNTPGPHTHSPGEAGAAAASHTHPLSDLAAGTLAVPLTMLEQASPPTSTATGTVALYAKNDGLPYWLDDVGTERALVVGTPAVHENPDFEAWDTDAKDGGATPTDFPSLWSAFWMSPTVTVAQSSDRVSGRYAIELTVPASTNPTVHSETVFDVSGGDIVTVQVWAKSSVAGVPLVMRLLTAPSGTPDYFGATTQATEASRALTTSWRAYQASLIVPTGHTKARLSLARTGTTACTLHLDNTGSSIRVATEGNVLTGSIAIWPLSTAPTGYLLCDGTSYNVSDYPNLAAILGSSGGTFTVPDLRDKFPIGASGTKAIGTTGGAATKTIAAANLPPHTHDLTVRANATAFGGSNLGRASVTGTTNTASTDNGGFANTPLDVMNPWRAVSFIIKT